MIGQYVRIVTAPNTRIGTIKAARFDRERVSFCFIKTHDLPTHFLMFGCETPKLRSATGRLMNRSR